MTRGTPTIGGVTRAGLLAGLLAGPIACSDPPPEPPLPEVDDPLPLVDPMIGAGGIGFAYGSAFVGAAVPHGLIKLGPDTDGPFGTIQFQHFSGYWAGDDQIQAFSHLHLHGTGAGDFGIIAVMPTLALDPAKTSVVEYEARFAKEDEQARPGRYQVRLDSGIDVALHATAHGAHHVYDFGGAEGALVIDLHKTLADGEITDVELRLDPTAQTIEASFWHTGRMTGSYGGHPVHVVMRTRQAWLEHRIWTGGPDGPDAAVATEASGDDGIGVMLRLPAGEPVELQVAVSLVSLDGARANLAAELPAWDADATLAAAEAAWRDLVGVVKITGGTPAQRRIFYSSLYKAFMMPTVIADADGTYQLAGQAPQVADGFTMMSDLSLWDTYRTVHPLYAWLAPASARDAVRSLTAFGQGLGAYPRWPVATGEARVMLGASAEIVVADAVLRGVPDVDAEAAWPILRAAAMDPVAPPGGRGGREHVELYMEYGYVPASVGRSASHTTEYAHDDFALGNLAAALGHDADAAALDARRTGWRALVDPAVGFIRAHDPETGFADDFDPLELSDDYAEANAWHSLWMVGAHDALGLVEALGGQAGFVAKLETFFEETRRDWETADPAAANFPRPYYWHGNEPDINAVYLFAQAGRPDLTQKWLRWLMDNYYTDGPDGLQGNDDGGTLASWYVLGALGVYPVPGSDRWILGAPRFPRARVLVGGRELVIEAEGISDEALYVQDVLLDGVPLDRAELTHAQLVAASELRFVMGSEPSGWGSF